MGSPALARAAAVSLGVGLALCAGPALAVDARTVRDPEQVRTVQDELDDLMSGRAPERRYAARNLSRQVRQALRASERASHPEREAEALLFLEDMDRLVAPQCIASLDEEEVLLPCARILGLLETQAARAPLAERLEALESRRARRIVSEALARIDAAAQSGAGT